VSENLSSLIDSLCLLKGQKKSLEEHIKTVEKAISVKEAEIMAAMDADGVIESKNLVGKVKIGESIVPHVENWDQFYDFIYNNKFFHLLERRPAVLAYRELLTLGRNVPGVLPFTKRKLTFTES
jgi:hypothetical protein